MSSETLPGQDMDGTSRIKPFPAEVIGAARVPKALAGSLPADVRVVGGEAVLSPAVVFAPARLSTPSRLAPAAQPAAASPDDAQEDFQRILSGMLSDQAPQASRFGAGTDPSYDFDEYVFLPSAVSPPADPQGKLIDPLDPRYDRLLTEMSDCLRRFVDTSVASVYNEKIHKDLNEPTTTMLIDRWYGLCSIRAVNALARYDRRHCPVDNLERHFASLTVGWLQAKGYGSHVSKYYQSKTLPTPDPPVTPPATPPKGAVPDPDLLVPVLEADVWNQCLTAVLGQIAAMNIPQIDPAAVQDDYLFDPLPADEVLFGLQVVHRQTWHLLNYGRGELVKTIPLGPRETRKVSVKTHRRTKTTRTGEQAESTEISGEATATSKDTSDVVHESATKVNRHVEAEAKVGTAWASAKVSGGLSDERSWSDKQTNSQLSESVQKTANKIKLDTKVTVSVEGEAAYDEETAAELTNSNDELGITYLYSRLQQRYWVSTEISEVNSIVLIPEVVPEWRAVTQEWIRDHADVIADALLDPSFGPALAALRQEPDDLSYETTDIFKDAARQGITSSENYKSFSGGFMPDMLASGQQFYERDYERRNALNMEKARRAYQLERLVTHVQRNILHYMRAIWNSEDYDQRMQRYRRFRVPTSWQFRPYYTAPSGPPGEEPLEVPGAFVPDPASIRPLTDVIDPVGPIGYLFNCAIFRLRNDPAVINMHQALAYLRATYAKFTVTVDVGSPAAGVTVRQAVAVSPRTFLGSYKLIYRRNSHGLAWYLDVPGQVTVPARDDGSLDAFGVRLWLTGTPVEGTTLTIRLRVTAEAQDPHLRLVQLMNPLPPPEDEAAVFSDELLAEMATMMPGLDLGDHPSWSDPSWTPAKRETVRANYHRYLMLRDSGRLVTLDTGNLLLDLEVSQKPALEAFKRLHRYLDVLKTQEDYRRRKLLLDAGHLGDPDIEHVTVTNATGVASLVAIPDNEPRP